MDNSLLAILLVALTFLTALNLLLTLRVTRFIAAASEEPEVLVPLIGKEAPPLWLGEAAASENGAATVLALLSPGCPDCKAAVPELAGILPAAAQAGVEIWVAAADKMHSLADLIARTPLAERERTIDPAARAALNPLGAAPLYIFIGADGVVEAGGYIGDEDWTSFVAQMREFSSTRGGL